MELTDQKKRNTAYKFRVGDILKGKPFANEGRLIHLEIGDKKVVRVNLIANVVDKFASEGEKKYHSLTLDDASGQIKLKTFGEDTKITEGLMQGDTLQVIGNVREYNSEIYVTPEVARKVDPRWLLVRKLEIQKTRVIANVDNGNTRDIILDKIRNAEKDGGIDSDTLIMETESSPDAINQEIKKLLEEGLIYEPRPGRLRYLG